MDNMFLSGKVGVYAESQPVAYTDIVAMENNGPTPVPLPAALPLLAGGLGLMGMVGWRRKRKAAA